MPIMSLSTGEVMVEFQMVVFFRTQILAIYWVKEN
nr:unnamed protein product [Callosobruchus analis]